MTHFKKSTALVFAAALLSGCATSTDMTHSEFGSAVKHNIAAQAVPPTETQKNNRFIPADPARRDLARDRYKADEVETPVPTNTVD